MLTRMQQRRGTQAEWSDSVISSTVVLSAGEVGLETDTGRFKIGNGSTVWANLPYYLPDTNPTNSASRTGKNNHDLYVKLAPIGPGYNQTITGINVLVPQANTQTPLTVAGLSGQTALLQSWRSELSQTTPVASISSAGKLTAHGAEMTASVDMNSNKITELGTPTSDADAATKLYVDQAIAGLAWKTPVNLVSLATGTDLEAWIDVPLTGNTGTVELDGHSALTQAHGNGYRLLLLNQTTPENDGIWVYSDNGTTYTLTRAEDSNTFAELKGASVFIQEGDLYGTSSFVQTNHYLSSWGGQDWVQFNGAAQITADGGLTKTGNVIAAVGTTDRILINPNSIDISPNYVGQTSITTVGNISTGTWTADTIAADQGGTGQTSYTVGDILYASSTSALSKLPAGTIHYPLVSGGAGTDPLYAQIVTAGIADSTSTTTGVTYAKIQHVSGANKILGRHSSGAGIVEELNGDNVVDVINTAASAKIDISKLPTAISGTGNYGTSTDVARKDHTHNIDDLADVIITGTPQTRQVIKFNGANWVNELPSGGISTGPTPPDQPSNGDAWFDTTDGSLYVRYDDGVGSPSAQWVQVKANSALEASILTRMSAVESRSTVLEAANAIRVANQAERDSKFPAPVQGNTVFRADLGYEEKYYAAYNSSTNPDGTTGTPGWYRYAGGAPLSQNYILNGDMEINQRGLTSTPTARYFEGYGLDMWKAYLSSDHRLSIQTASITGVPVRYAARMGSNTTSSATGGLMPFGQKLESKNTIPLRGKVVTVSFYIKFSNSTFTASLGDYGKFQYRLGYNTSTTDSAFTNPSFDSNISNTITNGSLPTTWTRISLTGVVPDTANNISITTQFLSTNGYGYTSTVDALYYDITGVQIEEGPVATPFRRNQENIQAELAACQRYYYRNTATASRIYIPGFTGTTTYGLFPVPLPSTMRIAPTSVENSSGALVVLSGWGSSAASVAVAYTSPTMVTLGATGTGYSAGAASFLLFDAGYVGFSAEL